MEGLLDNRALILKEEKIMKSIILSIFLAFSSIGFSATKEVNLQKENGQITWKGKKVTGEHFGNVQIAKGNLKFDMGELKGGTIEVDMRSIDCQDLKDTEYNNKLVNHLKSEDFFATEKHPMATFEITSVMPAKGATYDVRGDLIIKGIKKPASLKINRTEDKEKFIFKGDLVFDRTEYDIKYKSKKFFESLGDKLIYDEVTLAVEVNLPKEVLKN